MKLKHDVHNMERNIKNSSRFLSYEIHKFVQSYILKQ